MKHFFIPLALCTFSLSFSLQAATLRLESVMTEDEQQSIGLDKATDEQKAAFESWIGNWTTKVISQAPSYHPGYNIQAWVDGWPLATAPIKDDATKDEIAKQNKEINRKIVKNTNDGLILELADGSVWRIASFETYKTRRWQRGDDMEWSKTSYDAQNPYRLYDITMQQVAYASQVKPPNDMGTKKPEDQAKYAGSIRVIGVRRNGEIVDLENGTSWKIQLNDQIRTDVWKPGDRIKIQSTDYVIYRYLLKNIDSGESVRAQEVGKLPPP